MLGVIRLARRAQTCGWLVILALGLSAGLGLGATSLSPDARAADQSFIGHYTAVHTSSSGLTLVDGWDVSSCGTGCAEITGEKTFFQMLLNDGRWTMAFSNDTVCPDGTRVLDSQDTFYSLDANTLRGTVLVTYTKPACGDDLIPGKTFMHTLVLSR